MGIRDRPIAPGSPWQNGYAERLIGTVRRECLDRMLIFGEAHLRQILSSYASYYDESRTTYRCARIRRGVERSNDTEPLWLRLFCRGCIIAMRGYDFRKGQVIIKMLRSLAPFTAPESLGRTRSLADFITTTSGFRFSVHTGATRAQFGIVRVRCRA